MIYLVCGLGRCGTSLVMQMLSRVGFRVAGRYPDYEDPLATGVMTDPAAWAPYQGAAIKVIDPHIYTPPAGLEYRGVWLTRNHEQQARSHIKFLAAAGATMVNNRSGRRGMERQLAHDEPRALRGLDRIKAAMVHLRFEDLISRPELGARTICVAFGISLDVFRMADVVRPRSPNCFPTMMEDELLRGEHVALQ